MAGRFFLRFCLLFLSRHLPPPRYRRKRKSAEIASAHIRKRSFVKSRWDDTVGKSSRERQAPALYAAVRVRRRSYGVSHILRSVAGRITGHRRSLPQPSSAAWCPWLLTRAEVKDLLGRRETQNGTHLQIRYQTAHSASVGCGTVGGVECADDTGFLQRYGRAIRAESGRAFRENGKECPRRSPQGASASGVDRLSAVQPCRCLHPAADRAQKDQAF